MNTLPKLVFSDFADIRKAREKMGMNQAQFWQRVGITQSGGSRYETGRNMPNPVRIMLHLAYAPDARAQRLFDALRAWKTGKPLTKYTSSQ